MGQVMEKENYFFDIADNVHDDRVFVLIIYDIVDNKTRVKLAKMLLGYGFRVQKSAFEAVIPKKKYKELLERLPFYVSANDSIKVYKIVGKGQVVSFGSPTETEQDDIIVI
jgi:CRISPR-associated protein Cas2